MPDRNGAATREENRLKAKQRIWGVAMQEDCPTCKVKESRRCTDMRKDHEGRLLNWPHPSRVEAHWSRMQLAAQTSTNPEFTDLKGEL